MNPKQILVLGRHASMMERVEALLVGAGYVPVGILTDEAAHDAILARLFDAFVIGGGVEPASRAALKSAFAASQPHRPIVEHFGGAHGLVEHLRSALGEER